MEPRCRGRPRLAKPQTVGKAEPETLDASAHPSTFQDDLEAWFTRAASGDLFDEQVPRRPVRPSTITTWRYQTRAFAGALVALVAKIYLDANPGGYEVVRRVLGHQRIDTTTRFYAGTEVAAAVRHYDRQILALRAARSPRHGS